MRIRRHEMKGWGEGKKKAKTILNASEILCSWKSI